MSMGPVRLPDNFKQLPPPKRKRRWGWFLVWTLVVFLGGVATGPRLTHEACTLLERGFAWLGVAAPEFVHSHSPKPPAIVPVPAQLSVPAPAAQPAAAEQPPILEASKPVPTERQAPPPAPKLPVPAKPPVAATATPTEAEAPEPPAARGETARGAEKKHASTAASSKKSAKHEADPFATGNAEAPPPPPAEKPKKRGDKDIDDMLKEVQRSDPAPAPKREAPAQLAALTSSDISKAMTQVKARGGDCAQRLGEKGGVAALKITVGKDGKVSAVDVTGKLANTPVAECVEKAVRTASFPPNSGLRFDYRIDVH